MAMTRQSLLRSGCWRWTCTKQQTPLSQSLVTSAQGLLHIRALTNGDLRRQSNPSLYTWRKTGGQLLPLYVVDRQWWCGLSANANPSYRPRSTFIQNRAVFYSTSHPPEKGTMYVLTWSFAGQMFQSSQILPLSRGMLYICPRTK